MSRLLRPLAGLAVVALLCACSGAGSGSSAPGAPSVGAPSLKTAAVDFTILKPPVSGKGNAIRRRAHRAHYVSPNTVQIDFTLTEVNGGTAPSGFSTTLTVSTTGTSPDCTADGSGYLQCTASSTAPEADDTWTVQAYGCPADTPSCTSTNWSLLSSSSVTQEIAAGTNSIKLTLDPVVASLAWSPSAVSVGNGTAAGNAESLEALDASGAIIIPVASGSMLYQTPVYLKSDGTTYDAIYWSCSNTDVDFYTTTAHTTVANGEGTTLASGFNSPDSTATGSTKDPNGDTVTLLGNNGTYAYYNGTAQPASTTSATCSAIDSQSDTATLTLTFGNGSIGWTVDSRR